MVLTDEKNWFPFHTLRVNQPITNDVRIEREETQVARPRDQRWEFEDDVIKPKTTKVEDEIEVGTKNVSKYLNEKTRDKFLDVGVSFLIITAAIFIVSDIL